MKSSKGKVYVAASICLLNLLLYCSSVFSQSKCLSANDVTKATALMNNLRTSLKDNRLRRELLTMKETRQRLNQKIIDNSEKNQTYIDEVQKLDERNLLRLCEIIKQNGWITKETVDNDGIAAISLLLENNKSYALQKELYPLIVIAARKGLIGKETVAALIDGIRVGDQQPQIFGTQFEIKDELLYLYPLQNDEKVEILRKLYNLPTLFSVIKYSQSFYQMPVVKMPRRKVANKEKSEALSFNTDVDSEVENEESLKIASSLVNLNAIVFSSEDNETAKIFQKDDFILSEDGEDQAISFFSSSTQSIDLILALDNSGRTFDNQEFINKAVDKFISAARPTDRIAVFTFTGRQRYYTELAEKQLNKFKETKILDTLPIEASGVWSELQFAYQKYIKPENQFTPPRRSVIIFFTNGYDGNLGQRVNLKNTTISQSKQTFTDLLETVRNQNAIVIPIFVNSIKLIPNYFESEQNPSSVLNIWINKAMRQSKRTLQMLADESGGRFYQPRTLKDLDYVYETVIDTLSRVYSIGYEPQVTRLDGEWRNISLKIKNRPDLVVRTKKGYYAK